MSISKSLSLTILALFFMVPHQKLSAQESAADFLKKYEDVVNANNKQNSYDRVLRNSKNGNSWYFMFICEVIDANNTMHKATGQVKYLKNNVDYILGILNTARTQGTLSMAWKSQSQNNYNKEVDNQEVLLFEGYIFRYIAETYYLVSKLPAEHRSSLQLPVYELDNTFMKWYNRSMERFGDASDVYRNRTHIAALWANTALFLSKISYNQEYIKIYEDFYRGFDKALRDNLRKEKSGQNTYYIWNSTFDKPFTKQLKDAGKYAARIQDVSHGNRVIQYVISSHELGIGEWKKEDLQLFSNTLKHSIYKDGAKKLPDNIDGTNISADQFANTGWKQADGWIKLMRYDKDIFPLMLETYKTYQKTIDANSSNLQFYANFHYFLKNQ